MLVSVSVISRVQFTVTQEFQAIAMFHPFFASWGFDVWIFLVSKVVGIPDERCMIVDDYNLSKLDIVYIYVIYP